MSIFAVTVNTLTEWQEKIILIRMHSRTQSQYI